MSDSSVHRPHPEAPAKATLRPHASRGAWAGLGSERFEIVSRGDFVGGILYRRDSSRAKSAPLVLLQHGTAGDMHDEALAFAAPLTEEGFAIATIDLPLHGERSSPKLSERLCQGIDRLAKGQDLDAETRALVEEFARQSTSDLIRTLDALTALPSIDADRVAFVGFGVGALVGTYLLGADARTRAGVLAFIRGGRGPSDLDPVPHLARARETKLLFVSSESADAAEAKAADACREAAPGSSDSIRVPDESATLPDDAGERVRRFICDTLAR
jgi:dienelactone hydrolase